VMRHFVVGENVGLITSRVTKDAFSALLTKHVAAHKSATLYDTSYIFPLHLYPIKTQENIGDQIARKPNLNADIVQQIAGKTNLRFVAEQTDTGDTFAPVDILDYLYAVLHSPAYRNKFCEFLKIDFPRVPYPRDAKHFRALANLGAELRALHLLDSEKLNTPAAPYQQPGDNIVTTVQFDHSKVRINKTQYFAEVPQTAWEFPIGGYFPAQKYLKDRKNRALTWDEIRHYQRMIVALVETAKVMKQIDKTA